MFQLLERVARRTALSTLRCRAIPGKVLLPATVSKLRFRRRCLWRPASATLIINNHYQVRRTSRSALELCSWLHFAYRVPFPAPHAHFSLFARADIWWTARSRARAACYECDGRAGPCATASTAAVRVSSASCIDRANASGRRLYMAACELRFQRMVVTPLARVGTAAALVAPARPPPRRRASLGVWRARVKYRVPTLYVIRARRPAGRDLLRDVCAPVL